MGDVRTLQPVIADIHDQRLREEIEVLGLATGREILTLDGGLDGRSVTEATGCAEFQRRVEQVVGGGENAELSVAIAVADWDSPLLDVPCLRTRKIGFEDLAGAQLGATGCGSETGDYASPRGELAAWIGAVDPLRIGVFNATGGAGATTITALLAQHLADRGDRVAIVDDVPFTAGSELIYGIERDEELPLSSHGSRYELRARRLNGMPVLASPPVEHDGTANSDWWKAVTRWAEETSTHLVVDFGQAPSDPAGWSAAPHYRRPSHSLSLHVTVLLAQMTLPSLMAAAHAQPHLDYAQLPGPITATRDVVGVPVCLSHVAAVLGDFPVAHVPDDRRLSNDVTAGFFAEYLPTQRQAGRDGGAVYRAAGQILEEVDDRATEQSRIVCDLVKDLLGGGASA